jgi:RNA polymerase sigma-70 factor (ECF subfamily)
MPEPEHDSLAGAFQRGRPELVAYATRLVTRPDVAEELVQQAALRTLESERAPADQLSLRAWLFRVLTNLCIDHLRRHSTSREELMQGARERIGGDVDFVAASKSLIGSPEMRAAAREHLLACFACVLRNVSPEQAAALLLKDVYGFSVDETARMLGASFGQVKNWLQSARSTLEERYARGCALVTAGAPCAQCLEVDAYFAAGQGDPLDGTAKDLDARLHILREERDKALGPWHGKLLRLVDDILR